MQVDEFDYDLPEDRIAKYPLPDRAASRMMIVDRTSNSISHGFVYDLPSFLRSGDIVIFNDARVIPARLRTTSPADGELLLLEQLGPLTWRALGRPAKRMPVGACVEGEGFVAQVVETGELGTRVVTFAEAPDLDRVGEMPLPPYLKRAAEEIDRDRYQTTFARVPGAVAAPTAGLHFTPELMAQIPHTFITLFVGEGTFRDVKVDRVEDHKMHAERYFVSEDAADAWQKARRRIAIGTTVVRTLESAVTDQGTLRSGAGETSIFIHPPFTFRAVDGLLTNFHLPRSTLLMLVSAFAGAELTRRAYKAALEHGYRFFSYGDCMLIL